jgi:hypothetical protein
MGHIDGPNLYAYVKCNPIRLTDPSGKQSKEKSPLEQHYNDPTLHNVAGPPPAGASENSQDRDPSPDERRGTKTSASDALVTLWPPAADEKLRRSGDKGSPRIDLTNERLLADHPNLYEAVWLLTLDYEKRAHEAAELAKQAGKTGKDINERYLAWNLARQDYGPVAGAPSYSVLRDAEHYLNRRWVASEPGMVTIPHGLPPPAAPAWWNPTVPWSESMNRLLFDKIYNPIRKNLSPLLGYSEAGPDMFYFESAGYAAGQLLRSPSEADRNVGLHYEESELSIERARTSTGLPRSIPSSGKDVRAFPLIQEPR